jgi:hypothetical protein
MSFSEQTEKLTLDLIQAEYLNACEKFGEKYNSLHEGYAALLGEVEEVEAYFSKLKEVIIDIRGAIKQNKTEHLGTYIDAYAIRCAEFSIKELAQVGAVLMKIKNTLKGENA